MAVEFVKGWQLANVLGEGTFGEVRLLVNVETNECVATKVIDLDKYPNARNQIKKEVCIHRMLKHENIIKFFGQRSDDNIEYIFLEYASGGELFDRIEPDIGMDMCSAHRFFGQLLSGVEYLHLKGICHRDLKPENLLLDDNDFGMSTLFRHAGRERLLNQKCGTVPYMAPEIFIHKEYKAEPADIWSCGVTLVTLLSGELPWDRATSECSAFRDWKDSKIIGSFPWNKIDNLVLSLVRKILMPNVSKRYTLAQIKGHQWFKKKMFHCENTTSPIKLKRQCTASNDCNERQLSASQPMNMSSTPQMSTNLTQTLNALSFSQPAAVEDLFLSTQMLSTPFGSSQNIYQRLVKRMTRFFSNVDSKTSWIRLRDLFDKFNYNCKKGPSGQLTISTTDKRGMPLVFSTSVIEMGSNQILVDFRLTKGNGIEFKRHFVKIRNQLKDMIAKGPTTWPLAFATNSLP